MYLNVPVMLKKLDGQQNTHQIFLKFLYIICLVIVYQFSNREKKNYYILALKFDDFAISQWYMYMYYSDLHHKEINIVQKWPGHSNPLKFIFSWNGRYHGYIKQIVFWEYYVLCYEFFIYLIDCPFIKNHGNQFGITYFFSLCLIFCTICWV